MKKTNRRHLTRTIRKNAVSFFTVAFIAAVSIAIYLGMQSGTLAILQYADAYYEDQMLATLELSSPAGITEADLEALRAQSGVDLVEGGYTVNVMAKLGTDTLNLRAHALTESVNLPIVTEGELPHGADEVAIEEMLARERGLKVGDTLTVSHGGALAAQELRITAIINQPAFVCAISKDSRGTAAAGLGAANRYIALAPEAFDKAYFGNTYTTAYIINREMRDMYDYSDGYAERESALKASLAPFLAERAALRRQALLELSAPAIEAGAMTAEDLPDSTWLCLGRNEMGDLPAVSGLLASVNGISYSLSVIFLFVAVVVCHAAISRMIDEQRSLIGAQKALGFTSFEIMRHYLLYNLLCAVLGIVFGWLISIMAVEPIILYILTQQFLLGEVPLSFALPEGLIAAGLCFAIFITTTYLTCRKLARLPATVLLQGPLPAEGKHHAFERLRAYRRMSLYSRTLVKNVLFDRGRMMSTIVGVVGCISMLVICLSLKMAIDGSYEEQFDTYFLYDTRLEINTEEGDAAAFEAALTGSGVDYLPIQDKLRAFRVGEGKLMNAHLVSLPDGADTSRFMVLEEEGGGRVQTLPADGALISRKCAEIYALSEGDEIRVMDSVGRMKTLRVAGVIEHYLQYHLIVVSDAYHESAMGEAPDASVFLIKEERSVVEDSLSPLPGFMSLRDNSGEAENTETIYMAIAVCLALSVAMALLVLLNQITVHIHRKARELAVMRINGYTLKETKAYVYKDNIVLTAIGLVLGCVIGGGLSYIVILVMEREPSSYLHTPNPIAYLVSCAVGALFAFIVNIIALRRIDTLDLTHVNGN